MLSISLLFDFISSLLTSLFLEIILASSAIKRELLFSQLNIFSVSSVLG